MTPVISLTFEEAKSYYVIKSIFVIDFNTEMSRWSNHLRRHLGTVNKENYIKESLTILYRERERDYYVNVCCYLL